MRGKLHKENGRKAFKMIRLLFFEGQVNTKSEQSIPAPALFCLIFSPNCLLLQ